MNNIKESITAQVDTPYTIETPIFIVPIFTSNYMGIPINFATHFTPALQINNFYLGEF